MPARRTEFSGGTFHRDCLPRSGASRRRSCLLRCGPCRTSRLKFSAAGRPGPACRSSPLSPFRHNSRAAPPFSVLLAGPFRAPPGRAAPPFSSLQARPLLPIRQATCHVVAHWQGERGRNVPAGKELFLLCSICFAAPSATAPIAAGDSACGPERRRFARLGGEYASRSPGSRVLTSSSLHSVCTLSQQDPRTTRDRTTLTAPLSLAQWLPQSWWRPPHTLPFGSDSESTPERRYMLANCLRRVSPRPVLHAHAPPTAFLTCRHQPTPLAHAPPPARTRA